jgi:hypothetical protein
VGKIRDEISNKASGTFLNQDSRAATLSKAAAVAQGVLGRGSSKRAAETARNGRVFNDQWRKK